MAEFSSTSGSSGSTGIARALALVWLVLATLLHGSAAANADARDLYFGEALYHAYQAHYFDALERLDAEIAQHYRVDEPQLDSLYPLIDHAEFSVGDFELHYRMHHRAGRAIKAVLEGDVPEPVRNEAAYRLAKLHLQKDQPYDALHALDRIEGEVPDDLEHDIHFLRANVYMAVGRPAEAVEVLRSIQGSDDLEGFSAYNLGIALLKDDRPDEAVAQLDRAGRIRSGDPKVLAIRDKSNLVLGTLLFESSNFELSQRSLDRVRLEGPFSNLALLRAGWADASAENFDRAVVPWGILAEREPTDAAVQEALLALPYAYSKLAVNGRAAILYGRAVETFGGELVKVDASIQSIREGEFLEALVREEIRQDKDWVVRLRGLPEAPETFYLISLMASHDFQTALQNYLDLEDLRKKLVSWQASFDAFEDLIRRRRAYYEPLLPEIDERFRGLDAQMRVRLEQREHVATRLQQMLTAPRPDLLASSDEQHVAARIDQLEKGLPTGDPELDSLALRARRLRGVLVWTLETRYHERLTSVHAHLRALEADVDELNSRYQAFVRARQAATHSYVGYEIPIDRLRGRVSAALERLGVLMARQGHMLESVAIEELARRRTRLEAYQNQARFAFADSYDRAAKSRVD